LFIVSCGNAPEPDTAVSVPVDTNIRISTVFDYSHIDENTTKDWVVERFWDKLGLSRDFAYIIEWRKIDSFIAYTIDSKYKDTCVPVALSHLTICTRYSILSINILTDHMKILPSLGANFRDLDTAAIGTIGFQELMKDGTYVAKYFERGYDKGYDSAVRAVFYPAIDK
jgi:hypothetical protein